MPRPLLLALLVILMGCTEVGSVPPPAATQTLLPRRPSTPTATVQPGGTIVPVETAGPSPTPPVHAIVEGDTLLSIAIRYGVDLADLLLANPGVNPRLLIVGDRLDLPLSGAQGPIPSATPVPIDLSPVACYEENEELLTCLLTASVYGEFAVEGVVALVTLSDSSGQPLMTEPAYAPINLVLPAGRSVLVATFGPPQPRFSTASALTISALQASELTLRYAELDLKIEATRISLDGDHARAEGRVEVLDWASNRPVALRLVVIALDENDVPVGFRTWEAPEEGSSFDFDVTLFSLGPPIERLEILSEAPYLP